MAYKSNNNRKNVIKRETNYIKKNDIKKIKDKQERELNL